MKKLTISVIIYSLMLQLLIGCYSSNYLSYNELKEYKDNNDVVITTTDTTEYTLKRDSSYHYYSNWKFVDNRIEWTESKMMPQKDNPTRRALTTTNTTLTENEILKISVEEFDGTKTVLLSVGILAVILAIGAATYDPLPKGLLFK